MKTPKDHEKFLQKNIHRLVKDLPSHHYHGLAGTWSSSQFKDILDDEELFIRKYIKKEIPREEREVFDTGTYFHTAVLEPQKLKEEIAVYEGSRRFGDKWNKFREKHANKVIITTSQKEQGDRMIAAVKSSPTAGIYLDGNPEVSLFVELYIWRGRIYSAEFGKVLGKEGWQSAKTPKEVVSKGHRVVVKVRADCLNDRFVSDLKSTSGNARSEHGVRTTVSKYKYDLSAALYLDMFSLVVPTVQDFIWIFASKSTHNAQSWRASRDNILVGRAKYSRAMVKMADCAAANWELVDCLREAEPMPHEREWLIERETDLL